MRTAAAAAARRQKRKPVLGRAREHWFGKDDVRQYLIIVSTTHKLVAKTYAVLPSRSALSDHGLISDLFLNILLDWSSFCLKSPFFGLKSPKSLIFTCSAFRTKQKILDNFLNMDFFQQKNGVLDVRVKLLEQVWFWPWKKSNILRVKQE